MGDRTSAALNLAGCHLASLLLSEEELNPLAIFSLYLVIHLFFLNQGCIMGQQQQRLPWGGAAKSSRIQQIFVSIVDWPYSPRSQRRLRAALAPT